MNVSVEKQDHTLFAIVHGKVDTSNASDFESEIVSKLDETCRKLHIDISDMEYISSAGLRAFLRLKRRMDANGESMEVEGANEVVYESFMITGFLDLLGIEKNEDDKDRGGCQTVG